MSIKPILFSTEMVQALLKRRKFVTRRVLKPQPEDVRVCMGLSENKKAFEFACDGPTIFCKAPFLPGDILWVRETWWQTQDGKFHYLADYELPELVRKQLSNECKARPSIHMPKEAARIFLQVTNVRVERLQDISAKSAGAEGVKWETDNSGQFRRYQFSQLWDSTIKPAALPLYGWAANPWVWVIEFERCEKPEGWGA